MTEKTIGKYIKSQREALHMSQKDVARKLGVSSAYVSYWENGLSPVYAKYGSKLQRILRFGEEFNFTWPKGESRNRPRTRKPKKEI